MELDDRTVGTPTAARLYGVARGALWSSVREGRPPLPVIHVGRRVRWPLRPLMAQLGLTPAEVFAAIDAEEHDAVAPAASAIDADGDNDAVPA